MVYKVEGKRKVFLDSFLITVVLLLIGFSMGFYVENYRTSSVIDSYRNYEIDALDLKLQNYYYQIMNASSCDEAIEQNFLFADDLYLQGLDIEEFEQARQISDDIIREKRRHVLFKTELWLNTILLKEKCGDPFDTVVYIYSQNPGSSAAIAEQKIISNVLKDVKEEKGNEIILIPVAGDIGLGAVDLQMRIYGIENLPSILINEEVVLPGFHNKEEILSYLD